MENTNRVMLADSYKYSQPKQYPQGVTSMFDYMEARSSTYESTVIFGYQYILKKYFSSPITMDEVIEARDFAYAHNEPFEFEGWSYIVNELNGNLPVRIRAVKEGSIIPVKNVIASIESTDKKVFWIAGFLETVFMKVWYPITVATKAYYVKEMISEYLEISGTPENISFAYHNFGDRGSSSVESAMIGGIAHLTQFLGTDNFNALSGAKQYYQSDIAGFSIPATEHSTVTSWSKEGRFEMYKSYIETFKQSAVIACVMDSYDIYEDVNFITSGVFKTKIESDTYPKFVIRPDSGEPIEVIKGLIDIMEKNEVEFFVNEKGYKTFKKYAFIWGDGVNPQKIRKILDFVVSIGYSADIITFGSGGDLMQNISRDTCGFAIKCSSVTINGIDRDVYKDPITDKGKTSKKGKLDLFKIDDRYITARVGEYNQEFSAMQTIYENGQIFNETSLDEIRKVKR